MHFTLDADKLLAMLDAGALLAILGVGFSFASFLMKRMVPLRSLALFANVSFIGYAALGAMWPSLLLNCLLLPVNARRLWQIRNLTRKIENAKESLPVSEWLLPHMRRKKFRKGEILFRKGDTADRMFYIGSGELRLVEIGLPLHAGEMIGEIGLFSPDKKRTQTLVCESDVELYEMTEEMIFQLYYLHPKLGFFLMRNLAARLLSDLQRHGMR